MKKENRDSFYKWLTIFTGILALLSVAFFIFKKSDKRLNGEFNDFSEKAIKRINQATSSFNGNVDKTAKNIEYTVKKISDAFNAGKKAAEEDNNH